jgi:hypothetical protein
MKFNQEELTRNMADLAEFTGLMIALKDQPEVQQVLEAVPELAAELKPIIKGFNRFLTELKIDSLKQMEEAGIEREYAVAILIRENQAMRGICSALAGAKKSKK